jgi:hypothetical protein
MNVTLNRGVKSVDIPLVDTGNTPLFIADFGRPNQIIRDGMGTIDPAVNNQWSAMVNYNMVGKLFDYDDAIDLADLIKTLEKDTDLTLEPNLPEYDEEITVAAQAGNTRALSLQYEPGYKDYVQVELGLTRYGKSVNDKNAAFATPRETGNGPVTLTVAGETIELGTNLAVTRTIGRPNDVIRGTPSDTFPRFEGKRKSATDQFSISFETVNQGVEAITTLTQNLYKVDLGRNAIDLNFNGVYRMGTFKVIPEGSASFRQSRRAGERDVIMAPSLDLRVVIDQA